MQQLFFVLPLRVSRTTQPHITPYQCTQERTTHGPPLDVHNILVPIQHWPLLGSCPVFYHYTASCLFDCPRPDPPARQSINLPRQTCCLFASNPLSTNGRAVATHKYGPLVVITSLSGNIRYGRGRYFSSPKLRSSNGATGPRHPLTSLVTDYKASYSQHFRVNMI